jgi:pilus assembly protein CpaF
MEDDTITMQDIFMFDYGMGVDEHGRFRGHLKATGPRTTHRRRSRSAGSMPPTPRPSRSR